MMVVEVRVLVNSDCSIESKHVVKTMIEKGKSGGIVLDYDIEDVNRHYGRESLD